MAGPGVTTADQVVFEDLSKAHEVLDQRQVPFYSRLKAGKRPEAGLFAQALDKMGKRRKGGVPERQDIKGFEGDKTIKLYARTERFQRTPSVSVEAEELNRTAGLDANKAYNGQVTKKIKENKRDIDYWLLSDQESQEDDGITGQLLRGLGMHINDGSKGAATSTRLDSSGVPTLTFTDTQTTPPTTVRTPAAQIYAGALADFDEVAVNAIMQNRWSYAGNMTDFTFWVGSALKGQISTNWGRYQADKLGYQPIVRTAIADIDKRKLVTSGIDVYEGDYGNMTVELEPWMPTTGRGYGCEMDRFEKRVLFLARHSEFENKGGGRRGLIDSLLGAWWDDPRACFKVAPSDEVASVVDFDF